MPSPGWWELLIQWANMHIGLASAVGTVAAVVVALSLARRSSDELRAVKATRSTLAATALYAHLDGLLRNLLLSINHLQRPLEDRNDAFYELFVEQYGAMNLGFLNEEDLAAISGFPDQCAEKLVGSLACLQSLQHDVRSKGQYLKHWEADVVTDVFFVWHMLTTEAFGLLYEVHGHCERFTSVKVSVPKDLRLPSGRES
jgi:hypothetical protein